MKVKNIMFSGVMAAILMGATGSADAAISVASKDYVDTKASALVNSSAQALQQSIDGKVAQSDYDSKVSSLESAISTNASSIETNASAIGANTLSITNERTARENADADLQAAIDGKVAQGDFNTLSSKVDGIDSAYKAADQGLQSEIDAVKALTGTEGVAQQIANAVSAETAARELADLGLQSAIDAINDAETGILKSAQTYADQAEADAISAAATDATTKANQALTDAKAYADEKDAALKTNLEGQIATVSGNASQVANDLASYKTDNDAAVVAAKKAGDDAQADLDAYKSSNDTALAGVKTTAEQGVADAAAAAQAAADAAAAAAQALDDAKTYADSKDAATLASAQTYADGKASAAQAAAEATAADALATAKSDIAEELAKKIEAPAACETQDCVLSINKASGTISWTPLTEPVADFIE